MMTAVMRVITWLLACLNCGIWLVLSMLLVTFWARTLS